MRLYFPGSRGNMVESQEEAATSNKKAKTENSNQADCDAKNPKKKSLE